MGKVTPNKKFYYLNILNVISQETPQLDRKSAPRVYYIAQVVGHRHLKTSAEKYLPYGMFNSTSTVCGIGIKSWLTCKRKYTFFII